MKFKLQPLLEKIGFEFKAAPPLGGQLASEQAVDWWFSKIFALPDPDEVLRRAGVTRAHMRVLTGDDEISQALDTRNDALIGTDWRFEKPDNTDQASVDWLNEMWIPHSESVLRGCLAANPYGYSVQEVIYKRTDDGRIGWDTITEKPFEWFVPRMDGSVLYRSKANYIGEETDPRKFMLTVRQQTHRNPYGEALFTRLYWPWFFRQQGWRFWVKWLERFGTPLLVGTGPDTKALAKALSEAVQDAAIAVTAGTTVESIQSPGGADHFEKFDAVICRRIQKLVLGQTLSSDTTGSGGLGGMGAAKIHNEVRMDKRDADARMCSKTVQRLVDALWQLNGFAGDAPQFVMQDDTGIEQDRADRDQKLLMTGAVQLTEQYFLREYDFEEGDVIIPEKPAPVDPTGGDPTKPTKPGQKKFASGGIVFGAQFTPSQQVIEDALARFIPGQASPIPQADIRAAIMAATDPDDLVRKLSQLLAGHSLEEFQTTMMQAMFAADVMGYDHAR